MPVLYEVDYLLGVYDESRMGALRFKTDPERPFQDYNPTMTVPPWVRVKELQHSAMELELLDDLNITNPWLEILIDPKDDTNILLYEEWSDEAYYNGDHMKTAHLRSFMEESGAFLAGPPEISQWKAEREFK